MGNEIFQRISGRLGGLIDLNITFYKNGIPTDPFAIRKVSIYKSSVAVENLIVEVPIPLPCEAAYPSPVVREFDGSNVKPGVYHLLWDVPKTGISVPDIFFDSWCYLSADPHTGSSGAGSACDPLDPAYSDETLWQCCCNEFWLYPESYVCDTGLDNMRLAFEAMDIKFQKPEKRKLEVALTPLPLYDFPYNKVASIIPMLKGYITISTHNCETILERQPMTMGLRQGTYRSTPFVLQYLLDTSIFLRGSYMYKVEVELPNGETRISPDFILQVN